MKEIVQTQPNGKDPLAAILEQKKKAAATAAAATTASGTNAANNGVSSEQLEKKLSEAVKQLNTDFTAKLSQAVEALKTEIAEQVKANISNITVTVPESSFRDSYRGNPNGFETLHSEDSDREDRRTLSRVSPAPPDFGSKSFYLRLLRKHF